MPATTRQSPNTQAAQPAAETKAAKVVETENKPVNGTEPAVDTKADAPPTEAVAPAEAKEGAPADEQEGAPAGEAETKENAEPVADGAKPADVEMADKPDGTDDKDSAEEKKEAPAADKEGEATKRSIDEVAGDSADTKAKSPKVRPGPRRPRPVAPLCPSRAAESREPPRAQVTEEEEKPKESEAEKPEAVPSVDKPEEKAADEVVTTPSPKKK